MSRNLPRWQNVNANVGNGADYFRSGSSLINQAFKVAQDGISKYQEQEKENANTREANNTAKLLDIAKTRPLTKADYDAAGMVDRSTLNKVMSQQEKQKHDMGMDNSNLDLNRQKTTAQIAKWNSDAKAAGNKPSFWQKEMMKSKAKILEEQAMKDGMYGSYGKTKSGGGSDVKILQDIGITRHGEDQYGTADAENYHEYQTAIRKAQAAGIPAKTIKLAASQSVKDGGFWGEVSGVDETLFDVAGFLNKVQLQ